MILAIGELLFDELPAERRPGGAPFNFAQHLHRMGRDVRFVTRIGSDKAGDDLFETIRQAGLNEQYIQRDTQYPTGSVKVTVDKQGIPDYTILENVAYDHILLDALPPSSDTEMIYFGSLIQRTKAGRERLQEFLREQPASSLRFYDVNFRAGCMQAEILAPSLEQADILKLNDEELDMVGPLTGSRLKGDALARQLMEKFDIQQIAVTLGKRGSILYHNEQKLSQPAGVVPGHQIVDTVGAGDAFSAVLAHGILKGTQPQVLLEKATAFAERICTIPGAVPPDNTFTKNCTSFNPKEAMSEKDGLYIQMFSLHGLIRAQSLEMGRDADTGGQIKYVLEESLELSKQPGVERVDLFTRQIHDKTVSDDYGEPIEQVSETFRIIRIPCGGRKYMRKELLWRHLDEYIDKSIQFIKREGRLPDLVHGHYADAGYVAMWLSRLFGIPFIFTGHSLGRSKKQKLLADGMSEEKVVAQYMIDQRIDAEEEVLKSADKVFTSTRQEVDVQYGEYENSRTPEYHIIPPGIDLEKFYPYYHNMLADKDPGEEALHAQASLLQELERFFKNNEKPIVLALCRPDKRKNIAGLIQAFGEDKELQAMANLAIYAGIRKDISEKEDNERDVLTEMLLLMDKFDLYGKMAIPKKHDFQLEVPELYRIAAASKGVFVNPALTEPFGLTLLEAAATGLPLVATADGGPKDILDNCKNGTLIDPTDPKTIAKAIKAIVADPEQWETYSKNGIMNVRDHYTWKTHAQTYLKEVHDLVDEKPAEASDRARTPRPIGRRLAKLSHFLVSDIDNTLIGETNERLPELVEFLRENRSRIGFGIATGRTVDSAMEILAEHGLPEPDIIVSSVGAEIYYGPALHPDQGWKAHLSKHWKREKIRELLDSLDFLEYQEEATQRPFKISYNMDPAKDRLTLLHDLLQKNRCRYTLIYSHDQFLDVLPYHASKGKAVRYLSYKWNLPLANIMVAGDSGNDAEMLRGDLAGVVVGNYSPELEQFRNQRKVYFARAECAGGILEGIDHYGFRNKLKEHDE